MSRARNYFRWQCRLVAPHIGDRVVEVGCGTGNFTGCLLEKPAVLAVDPQPDCIQAVSARFPGRPNLTLRRCGPPDPAFLELRAFNPDSCVCLNVLEHIRDDVAALASMRAILRPGGKIVVFAPAFDSLYGPIDYALGHYRRYTKSTLRAAARQAGLEVARVRYVNLPGFFGWWMNSRILRLTAQSPGQIALFDHLIVPAVARIETILPPPFGQSVFAVLRPLPGK